MGRIVVFAGFVLSVYLCQRRIGKYSKKPQVSYLQSVVHKLTKNETNRINPDFIDIQIDFWTKKYVGIYNDRFSESIIVKVL